MLIKLEFTLGIFHVIVQRRHPGMQRSLLVDRLNTQVPINDLSDSSLSGQISQKTEDKFFKAEIEKK